jgi:methanogenic corrinoid protein MtbC1
MPRLARQALDQGGLSKQPGNQSNRATVTSAPESRAQASNDRVGAADRHNRLSRTLELDIIPRLVDVHRSLSTPKSSDRDACEPPTAGDVEEFVRLVLALENAPAQTFVDALGQRGMSVETLYLDLLAPAAQHLNYLWRQDLCDFTQVTLGLARLQGLLHDLSPSMDGGQRPFRGNARRVLLLPACGEQQAFGLSMVAEFFHHAGWDVDCGHGPIDSDAADLARTEWFDVIGLAAGSETRLEPLRQCILNVRMASRNKDVRVMVGGPIFAGHPERVKFVGADACGLDGKQAPVQADRLIASAVHNH